MTNTEEKQSPILPERIQTFEIKVEGAFTGKTYEGEFRVEAPNVRRMGRIGVELAKLNQGVPHEHLDDSTANLHYSVSYLRVVLVEVPSWFKEMDYGLDTEDHNVLPKVLKAATSAVDEYRKAAQGKLKGETLTKD